MNMIFILIFIVLELLLCGLCACCGYFYAKEVYGKCKIQPATKPQSSDKKSNEEADVPDFIKEMRNFYSYDGTEQE